MTGGCTCPIYYQGVVSVEKGSVIVRYELAELIKTVCEPCSPAALFQACQADVLVRFTTVVSGEKGSVIIRYKKNKLAELLSKIVP
jgi:hypothetical protein